MFYCKTCQADSTRRSRAAGGGVKHIKILTDALSQWSKRYRNFGDYSVTTLLDSPRQVLLARRHKQEIVQTPEQQVAAFIGSGVHSMFEESLKAHSVIDPRYDIERTVFDKYEDRLIAGKFDILWDSRHLYDIKTCKTWKLVFDPGMEDWHKQLNIYAAMLRNRGLEIKSINVVAVYLDWMQNKAVIDKSYPQDRVVEYELKLWDHDFTMDFLRNRINLFKANEEVADDKLPECTDEEMWVRNNDTKYALIESRIAKRAFRVFDTLGEAENAASNWKSKKPGDSYIEIRKPTRTRCLDWCDAAPFCNQFQQWNAKAIGGIQNERIML